MLDNQALHVRAPAQQVRWHRYTWITIPYKKLPSWSEPKAIDTK